MTACFLNNNANTVLWQNKSQASFERWLLFDWSTDKFLSTVVVSRSSEHWICLLWIKWSVGAVCLILHLRKEDTHTQIISRYVTEMSHTLHHMVISPLLIRLPVARGFFTLCQMHIPHKLDKSFFTKTAGSVKLGESN